MPHSIGLYIRVSKEEQAMRSEGSLDSQKHRLNAYVDIKNMQDPSWGKVIELYVDDVSGKDTNRPKFQKLLRDIKGGRINMVLVTELSRLSRSIKDFCELLDYFKENKTKFLSLKDQFDTSTAAGEMMLFNMINLAQFERRQISERVSINFHTRAMRGFRNGGAATLGFQLDPNNKAILKLNLEETEYVKTIFQMYMTSGSLYQTAAKLREMGIPCKAKDSKVGGNSKMSWNVQTLSNLLQNYGYAGLREVNKCNKSVAAEDLKPHEQYQVVKAAWDAIIEPKTFLTIQEMLEENRKLERTRLSNKQQRVFLLTGLIRCAECGRFLTGATGHGRNNSFKYYKHRPIEGSPVTCSIKYFNADEIEESVTNHLSKVVAREGYFNELEETLKDLYAGREQTAIKLKRHLELSLSETDADIKKLVRLQMRSDDADLAELYSDQLKELQRHRQELLDQVEKAREDVETIVSPSKMRANIESNISVFQKTWAKAPSALKKKLLRLILEKIVLTEESIEIYYHSDQIGQNVGQPDKQEATSKSTVSLAEIRLLRSKGKDHHNAMVFGSPIVKIGCGGYGFVTPEYISYFFSQVKLSEVFCLTLPQHRQDLSVGFVGKRITQLIGAA